MAPGGRVVSASLGVGLLLFLCNRALNRFERCATALRAHNVPVKHARPCPLERRTTWLISAWLGRHKGHVALALLGGRAARFGHQRVLMLRFLLPSQQSDGLIRCCVLLGLARRQRPLCPAVALLAHRRAVVHEGALLGGLDDGFGRAIGGSAGREVDVAVCATGRRVLARDLGPILLRLARRQRPAGRVATLRAHRFRVVDAAAGTPEAGVAAVDGRIHRRRLDGELDVAATTRVARLACDLCPILFSLTRCQSPAGRVLAVRAHRCGVVDAAAGTLQIAPSLRRGRVRSKGHVVAAVTLSALFCSAFIALQSVGG